MSPSGEFWECREARRFDALRDEVAQLARGSGFLVIPTQDMMATLQPFRKDAWHFGTNRGMDYGLAYQWQRIVTTTLAAARFLCHDDPLARALASLPMRSLADNVGGGKEIGLGRIARFTEPLAVRTMKDRFEVTPHQLSCMLEEAIVFFRPADSELMVGAVAKAGR